jgi:predicted dehydrogenase
MAQSLEKKIHVALVGLRFGAQFIPIYLQHPNVASLTICDIVADRLTKWGDQYEIEARAEDLSQILGRDDIDAVHLVTPIPVHVEQTLAVLGSGKHCACTVPMATSLKDLNAIVAAQRKSNKNYMMMKTSVYCREFLFAQTLVESGVTGKIQFLRGAHYQDDEGRPWYWKGLPPFWYGTHAISPLLALSKTRAEKVHCFGTGTMREELVKAYGNPYPMETAIFKLAGTDIAAEATRSLFHLGREYQESFNVYGEDAVFEWGQMSDDEPALFQIEPLDQMKDGRGRKTTAERVTVPDYAERLPEPIRRFTKRGVYSESNPHLSFLQGGGHGGAHPHLVQEFVQSIVEERPPYIDSVTAANWTAAGICAHESAMNDGGLVTIPSFDVG